MKFENPNNLIKPETDNMGTTKPEVGSMENVKNTIENGEDIKGMVIERVEKELKELGNIEKKGGRVKRAIEKCIFGISIVLATMTATEVMASDPSSVGKKSDDMFKELNIETEKMDIRKSIGELFQEKKIQQAEEKKLTPKRPHKIGDLFNEEDGLTQEESDEEKIENRQDDAEPNNEFLTEGLSEKEAQIQFLKAKIFEIKKLLDKYYDEYGDRGNYDAFEAKVMDIMDHDAELAEKIKKGEMQENSGSFNEVGKVSPKEMAKSAVENAAAQTKLTTTQEKKDSAFDELDKL